MDVMFCMCVCVFIFLKTRGDTYRWCTAVLHENPDIKGLTPGAIIIKLRCNYTQMI